MTMDHDPFHEPASAASMSPATQYTTSSTHHHHSGSSGSGSGTNANSGSGDTGMTNHVFGLPESLKKDDFPASNRGVIGGTRHEHQTSGSSATQQHHHTGSFQQHGSSGSHNFDDELHGDIYSQSQQGQNLHNSIQTGGGLQNHNQHHHQDGTSTVPQDHRPRRQSYPLAAHGVSNTKQHQHQPLQNSNNLHKSTLNNGDKHTETGATNGGINHRNQQNQAQAQQNKARLPSHDLEPQATHISRRFSPEMLIQKSPKPRSPGKHRMLGSLPVSTKNHIVAVVAEFAGTFMFLFFAFGGTQVVNGPANSQAGTGGITYATNDASKLLYISLSFGMSLMVTAWVFFRISGGLFNPAVTLGLAVVGVVKPVRAVLVTISQIVGGIAAAAVIDGLTPGTLNVNTKLLATDAVGTLGMTLPRGVFMEMFMTAQLVFTVFMLAAEKHRATFMAPVGIGLSLFIAELMSVYYTGGSLNPARSFGPSVIEGFNSDHWIYWVGPILGAFLASGFYALAKAIKYETVNPGQDEAGEAAQQMLANHQQMEGASVPTGSVGFTNYRAAPRRLHTHERENNKHNPQGHDQHQQQGGSRGGGAAVVDEKHYGGSGADSSGTAAGGAAYADGPDLEAGRRI